MQSQPARQNAFTPRPSGMAPIGTPPVRSNAPGDQSAQGNRAPGHKKAGDKKAVRERARSPWFEAPGPHGLHCVCASHRKFKSH